MATMDPSIMANELLKSELIHCAPYNFFCPIIVAVFFFILIEAPKRLSSGAA